MLAIADALPELYSRGNRFVAVVVDAGGVHRIANNIERDMSECLLVNLIGWRFFSGNDIAEPLGS